MRRVAAAVLVSLLLVVAGCIGGPAGDDPTTGEPTPTAPTTETDEPTTTNPSDESDASPGPLPPGVSDDGVTNRSALLSAHSRSLAERGFALGSSYRVDGSDGEAYTDYRLDRETRAAVGFAGARSTLVRVIDGERLESRQWLNESLMLTRTAADGEVRYRGNRIESAPPGPALGTTLAGVHRLESVLRSADLAVESVTQTADGSRARLESTAFGSAVREDGQYASGEVTVVVDGDGVIRSVTASGTTRDGGSFTFEYRVERLGVETVERPEWLADAPPVVRPELDFSFENCTTPYLVLEHTGGDPLPAGSTLAIEALNSSYRVTLDAALDGGNRYIYLTTGGDLRLSREPPAADERASIGNDVGVNVVTDAGYQVLSAGMGFGCESASAGGSAGSGSTGSDSAGSGSTGGDSASGGSAGSDSASGGPASDGPAGDE